jgi:hypothetical protein
VEVGRRLVSGEDVLRNMARAGAFGPDGMAKVERVIAEKQAALAAKKEG